LDLGGVLRKIEKAYEKRRDDAVAFEREAPVLVDYEELSVDDRERALARIQELRQTLPVKPPSSEEALRATARCRKTAQRLRACTGYDELIDTWPAPIAHEVRELVRVLEGNGREAPSPEAALLQLRDVSETLVKLPASVLALRLIERGGEDALDMRRLLAIVSGGAWNEVARSAAERLRHVEPDGPFASLAELFGKGSRYRDGVEALGQARNTYLGHGAMRPNPSETAAIVAWAAASQPDDPSPSSDMARKPTLIDALESGTKAGPWTGLRLEAVAEDGSAIDLTGAAALDRWFVDPRHVKHDDRVLRVRLVRDDGGVALELGPLVAARICRECDRRDVFFFDTVYDRKPWKSDFLDYGRGHKSRFKGDETADLRAEFSAIPLQEVPPTAMAEESLESGAAIAGLDRLRVDQRYLSPTYLREPLARFLELHDCGTYWLQAPAHVGKTMFVLGLAAPILADSPITSNLGPGGGIAAFFCKREYREGRYAFLNDLSDQLKTALDLRRDKNAQFPEPREVITADDKGLAFVAWLDRWRMLAKRADRPLLIVIDGLDEADPPSGGDSLLDLLPKPSQLTRGLYFLLTSRPIGDGDCPPWLGPAVAPLASEPRRLDVDDCGYRTLLTDYVCKALDPTYERRTAIVALSERLIAQAEDRFAFLSFLVEQLRGGHQIPETVGELGTGQEMYDRFIDALEARYGTKRGDVLLDVLASLAAAEFAHGWTFGKGAVRDEATGGILVPVPRAWPGLELDVLAAATDLDERQSDGTVRLSVPFVEALIVLQGTLWVWRGSERDVRYRLGLKEFAARLAARRPEALRRAYGRLAGLCLDAIESLGQESSGPRGLSGERPFRALFALLPGLVELSDEEQLNERFRTLPVIEMACALEFAREEAGSRRRIAWCDGILAALTHGAGAPRTDTERRNDFAQAYVTRGALKCSAPSEAPVTAIPDFNHAIALQEALRKALGADWPPPWHNDLALTYMNRGVAKEEAPGHGPAAAIADYDRAIALREALREALGDDWPLPWRDGLAGAYMNRGNAKRSAPGHGSAVAIADFDRAIALREGLREALGDDWPFPWRNELAVTYSNRGIAKRLARGHGPAVAIADFDRAIALMEALREALGDDWPSPWCNDLANVYLNRGNAKQDASDDNPAASIADYDRAIALQEALREALGDDWPSPWCNGLAQAYTNRGAAKLSVFGESPIAAIDDFDHAVALQEALREALGDNCPLTWRNELARAYINRGTAKHLAPGYDCVASIADYESAIALMEALREGLGDDWPVPWRNDLARGYVALGTAKEDDPGYGPAAAIADYNRAIALREGLRQALGDDWSSPWRNELARTYSKRADAKQDAPGHGPAAAIADYDRAIALREGLRQALGDNCPFTWCNELAGTYSDRGVAKQDAPGYGPAAAIADYNRAVSLREALREGMSDNWPLRWRNQLAGTYMNRADAKRDAPGYVPDAAIADYDRAIALQEALRDALGNNWPLPWRNNLASAYMNRGVAKCNAAGFGPGAAIADFDRAIALRKVLGDDRPLPWQHDLARTYMNRGNAKQSAPGFGPAASIADYDCAITLQDALRKAMGDAWPFPWQNDLALTYMNRGFAKQSIPSEGLMPAIADYDHAIALEEALRETLGNDCPLPWCNNLATAYMNRCNAKRLIPNQGNAAIVDHDRAIVLQEAFGEALFKKSVPHG
jgi:hypothetical protein